MTRSLFEQRLAVRLKQADVQASAIQFRQLETYYELLRRWNDRVNLTSLPLDDHPDRTLDRLLVEPLVAATLVSGARAFIDLGSGGGSPGIPMKIAAPDARLLLVEARERKSAFLREVVRVLALPDADVLTARAEDVPSAYDQSADVISARALRLDGKLIHTVCRLLKPGGKLLTFGTRHELTGFRRSAEKTAGANIVVAAWTRSREHS